MAALFLELINHIWREIISLRYAYFSGVVLVSPKPANPMKDSRQRRSPVERFVQATAYNKPLALFILGTTPATRGRLLLHNFDLSRR